MNRKQIWVTLIAFVAFVVIVLAVSGHPGDVSNLPPFAMVLLFILGVIWFGLSLLLADKKEK